MSTISASTTTTTAYKVAADTTGTLVLQTGATPTTAVTIDGSQNVLVGGTTQYGGAKITISNGGAYLALNSTSGGYSLIRGFDSGTERWSVGQIGFGGTDGMAFYTGASNTERARIDSSGNLLVGTTGLDGRFRVEMSAQAVWARATNHLNNGTQYFDSFRYNGTEIGKITGNNSNVSYVTSSDYRLKENIAPMTGALAVVAQLKPCTYTWKLDGAEGQGFIAHELQAVVPDAVVGEKDAVNEDGSIKPQGIDTSFLVATLTAAIQEQQALITQLQADVAALKGAA